MLALYVYTYLDKNIVTYYGFAIQWNLFIMDTLRPGHFPRLKMIGDTCWDKIFVLNMEVSLLYPNLEGLLREVPLHTDML